MTLYFCLLCLLVLLFGCALFVENIISVNFPFSLPYSYSTKPSILSMASCLSYDVDNMRKAQESYREKRRERERELLT